MTEVVFSDEVVDVKDVEVTIKGEHKERNCRVMTSMLDRRDSSFIVRYKLYETCKNLHISIQYKSKHVAGSPYFVKGTVLHDDCFCPEPFITTMLENYGCKQFNQIHYDLSRFKSFSFDKNFDILVKRFKNSHLTSVCHYVVKNNEVYRNCYGEHVGFRMFMDTLLLSLTRKVELPDMEFFSNLGDWPLEKLSNKVVFPMFSWCGSKETADIVMPTYDIMESSLTMGRVTLDMLSVQGNIEKTWKEKEEKAFWRGRDASRERLKLIDISRSHPDLFNASLTNFFFFKDEEKFYGPKAKHVSFFKFFDYKYQINLDGTVAAYRFPYLLAGDSLVLKQNSPYYEHFYSELEPWVHYVPVKRDLSDLVEKIKWAKENDDKAKAISQAGRRFAVENLLPQDILCYHVQLFYEWSKRLLSKVEIKKGMERVQQSIDKGCCHRLKKDEL
ncbi:KDEL motif-containing protein 1-like isoform X2 [Cimex lectularius]|uniref:Glycosyl transferase CAP10 domain-containing protein n=1 Tax=Cimex lectularius TaxID=79782 RepID=A0A8I6RY07_CIMLE|nr:KDEL motif-containing protein 1-like isoform X2 [Cimex lectularius]